MVTPVIDIESIPVPLVMAVSMGALVTAIIMVILLTIVQGVHQKSVNFAMLGETFFEKFGNAPIFITRKPISGQK